MRRKNIMMAREPRQMCSPDDGSAVRDGGKRGKAERQNLMNVEAESEQDRHVRSFVDRSSQRLHRSCVHIEVPLMFSCSTLFLEKPLFISVIELDSGTIEEPVSFRSSLSVQLGVSSRNQPTRKDEGHAASQGHQPGRSTVQRTVPACRVTDRADYPDPRHHGDIPGLSPIGRPKPSNPKTVASKENADEFRREPLTRNLHPGMNFITSPLK